MGSIVKSPSEIIADEVGAAKAHTILAALRGQGWEVARKNQLIDDCADYFRQRKSEFQDAEPFPY